MYFYRFFDTPEWSTKIFIACIGTALLNYIGMQKFRFLAIWEIRLGFTFKIFYGFVPDSYPKS